MTVGRFVSWNTLIEVRKARYIYMWYKQSEVENIEKSEQFRYKPTTEESMRGGSGSGQVYAFVEYRRVEWTALVDI